ncbi:hypothetical protein [Candidatus Poriferisocius sp.]|uniref:hypothetical protein n=1 Tax=Candidatus Poriferisocius sp. TaxID=3101276 RepID=UPI003B026AAA
MGTNAATHRAVATLARQLELCRVSANKIGVVLADDYTDPLLVRAASEALTHVGAHSHTVLMNDQTLNGQEANLGGPDPPEMVVNLLRNHLDTLQTMVPPCSRVLSVVADGIEDLRGLVPHTGLSRRASRGLALLEAGQELNVGDSGGTNLRMGLNGAHRWKHDGLVTTPGTVAEWPRGIIGVAPAPGTAEGTVVMSPGDIWLPMGWYARSPVTLTFEKGIMVDLDGPSGEVDAVRAQLASVGSRSAYRLAAVEIGMQWIDRLRSPALFEPGFADSLNVGDRYGHVVVTTGDLPTVGIACCLRKATVAVNEVAAVRAGHLQGELAPDIYEQAAHQ